MGGININQVKKTSAKGKVGEKNKSILSLLNKDISFGAGKVNPKKKEAFFSELGVLLEAGVDIKAALDIVAKEIDKKKTKNFVSDLNESIVKGTSLSESMEKTKLFSEYEFYSVRVGEDTGKLPRVLNELGAFHRKSIKQRRQLVNILTYPVVVSFTSVGAVVFMLYFVVPMFADVFKRFGSELPDITKVIISLSNVLKNNILFALLVIGAIVFSFRFYRNTIFWKKFSTIVLLNIPVAGEMARKLQLAKMANIMALLVQSKIPLLQAIGFVKKMVKFYPLQVAMENIEEDILQGKSLHVSMDKHKIFPSRMVTLVKVGEEINQLDRFFQKIADQYSDEVEHQTGVLGNLIEPLMLIFLGALVGIILIAMYLPLFNLGASFG